MLQKVTKSNKKKDFCKWKKGNPQVKLMCEIIFKLIVASCGCQIILGDFEPYLSVVSDQTRGLSSCLQILISPSEMFHTAQTVLLEEA